METKFTKWSVSLKSLRTSVLRCGSRPNVSRVHVGVAEPFSPFFRRSCSRSSRKWLSAGTVCRTRSSGPSFFWYDYATSCLASEDAADLRAQPPVEGGIRQRGYPTVTAGEYHRHLFGGHPVSMPTGCP